MFGKQKSGALLYEQNKAPVVLKVADGKPVFAEFRGAAMEFDDDGKNVGVYPRETIMINVKMIEGFYDHTILLDSRKVRVMETLAEIWKKIGEALTDG